MIKRVYNKRWGGRHAQATLEYAVLFIAVAVAVVAMQTYMHRSAQGKLRNIELELAPRYKARVEADSLPSLVDNAERDFSWAPEQQEQ